MLTNQQKKGLQALLQHPAWSSMEAHLDLFMKENFSQASIRRDTEFQTIWEAASMEGGRMYLQSFFAQLEQEAHNTHDE